MGWSKLSERGLLRLKEIREKKIYYVYVNGNDNGYSVHYVTVLDTVPYLFSFDLH